MAETFSKCEEIRERYISDSMDVISYVWKSMELIRHETKIEEEKLEVYFPLPEDDDLANLRRNSVTYSLNNVFPYLISVGNLFSVMSFFESYLLILSYEIEKNTGTSLGSCSGNGMSRMLKYLRKVGIDTNDIKLFPQVEAAMKIRNCFSHASGVLAWSKEKKELKRIHKSRTYLSRKDRGNKHKCDLIDIVATEFGERIQLDNKYVFVLTDYLKDVFNDFCQEADLLKLIK